MAAGTRRSALLACALAASIGVALVLLTFYPGVLTVDSSLQLQEARARAFFDWHPPLMAAVWSIIDRIVPGPLGMLLLSNAVFWTGLALAVYLANLSPAAAALSILGVGLLPPVFSALGVISKDVAMGGALLLAFALLWVGAARASRPALLAALPLVVYAAALRHNAAAAILPLALWAPFIWRGIAWPGRAVPRWQLLGVGLALFALLGGAAVAINATLTAKRLFPAQLVLLHDLAGMSLESDQLLFPASLRTHNGPLTLDAIRCSYSPDNGSLLFSGTRGGCPQRIVKITDAGRMADVQAAWWRAMLSRPRAYLAHRWRVFSGQLGLGRERVCYPFNAGDDPRLGVAFAGPPLYQSALALHTAAAYRTPLFRGWIYLVLLAAAMTVVVWRRGPVPALVLAASGLCFGLAYLIVSPACAFRYNWWTVVAALTTVPVLAGHRPACYKRRQ
jgi:hypothetical protein